MYISSIINFLKKVCDAFLYSIEPALSVWMDNDDPLLGQPVDNADVDSDS